MSKRIHIEVKEYVKLYIYIYVYIYIYIYDSVQSIGQIELNYVLMLKWIAWNGTVLC